MHTGQQKLRVGVKQKENYASKFHRRMHNNRALFKIFGALSKDTYKDICKYFGIRPMDEQISARQSKFYLRYCATEALYVMQSLN